MNQISHFLQYNTTGWINPSQSGWEEVLYPTIGTGSNAHTWQATGSAYFRIQNQNSGKVLGVSNMSTANSVNVVQFSDNGTADHLWTFI